MLSVSWAGLSAFILVRVRNLEGVICCVTFSFVEEHHDTSFNPWWILWLSIVPSDEPYVGRLETKFRVEADIAPGIGY